MKTRLEVERYALGEIFYLKGNSGEIFRDMRNSATRQNLILYSPQLRS
jgi:hypothetical protein